MQNLDIVNIWSRYIVKPVVFLPELGPIYLSPNSVKKVLEDLLNNSNTGNLISYDKNKRWFSKKRERIIINKIKFENNLLLIPVENVDNKKSIKIFCYTNRSINVESLSKISDFIKQIKSDSNQVFTIYNFQKPEININFQHYITFLKKIISQDGIKNIFSDTFLFDDLPDKIQSTFIELKNNDQLQGFGFLGDTLLKSGKNIGPVFCAIKNNHIIGAIGPLTVNKDAFGVTYLLPPYFGVIEKERQNGYGKKLWQIAINYALSQKAEYVIFQNTIDSIASKFYTHLGIENVDDVFVYTIEQ